MTNPFHWFWYKAERKTKIVIAAIILILFGVIFFWSCGNTLPWISTDTSYQELAGENNVLREQNAVLRSERDDFKAKGEAVELERDALAADLAKFGRKAAEGVEIQKQAGEQNEKDIAIIGPNNISQFDRCQRMCATRAALGGPCVPAFCDQYR